MYSYSATSTEGGGGGQGMEHTLARGNTYRILVGNLQGWIPLVSPRPRRGNKNEIYLKGTGLEGVDDIGADGGCC
jgi:hypothetical protein